MQKVKISNFRSKSSLARGKRETREMQSGTTITSHRELHCIHDLRFRIDLALVLAGIRLSGVVQPESPGVAARRVLGSKSRVRAERKIS